MSKSLLDEAGYVDIEEAARISPGVTVSFRATDLAGVARLFEMGGTNTPARPGLSRIDAVWRTIAKASIVNQVLDDSDAGAKLVVLTSGTVRGGPLAAVTGRDKVIRAIIDVTVDDAAEQLRDIFAG